MPFNIEDGPRYVHLDLTGNCNLDCRHCRNTSTPDSSELETDEILSFLEKCSQFDNFKSFYIGGGEPLLREEALFKIIKKCNKIGVNVGLNTNGILVNEKLAKDLEGEVEVVQVSMDGGTKETHEKIRGENTFEKTINAVKKLRENNIRVFLRMTLNNINYNEIEAFIELAKNLDVNGVSFYRTLPVGRAIENEIKIEKELYSKVLEDIFKRKNSNSDKNFEIIVNDPLKVLKNNKLNKKIRDEYNLENSLGGCLVGVVEFAVNNVGKIYPCTMQAFSVGNIKHDDILKVWKNSEHFKKLRDRSNLKGECYECNLRNACGGCRAAAYHFFNDYFESDPHCPRYS